jgi:hypothetical protein
MKILKRYEIPLDDVNQIMMNIECYQKILSFYEDWVQKHGEYDYVDERVQELSGVLCEYLIAREYAKEGARTFGDDKTVYAAIEIEFKRLYPNLEYPFSKVSGT